MTASRAAAFDVLCLGLGPAGARAAAQAARAGLRVLAFDRRAQAGLPVQCAEFVPASLAAEVAPVRPATRQAIGGMRSYVEAGAADLTEPFPGHMLDRAQFDASLVQEARAAGADCRLGVSVRSVAADGTLTLADGSHWRAPVLIGADGPRSLPGRAIGSFNAELLETRQLTVELLVPMATTDIFLSQEYPGGYAWLFPKAGVAHLGVGLDAVHRRRLKPLLEDLHARLQAQGQVGARILARTGGAIPAGGMLRPWGRLGGTTVLLAGDAAGLANPVTGAGIASAALSGTLAGAAAQVCLQDPQAGAQSYAEELEDLYGAALARAVARRRELAASVPASPQALRRGWIAYPEYWTA
jgi:geranylgeranyl reductase family protein